jgi:hypothetical protein
VRRFAHTQRLSVRDVQGDPAALGAAVTVELCGHWEHDDPCRWPHHTSADVDADGTASVTVRFDADPSDVPAVRERIARGLAGGALTGPDDGTTTWGPVESTD